MQLFMSLESGPLIFGYGFDLGMYLSDCSIWYLYTKSITKSDSSLMLKGPGLIFKFAMVENSSAFWILN